MTALACTCIVLRTQGFNDSSHFDLSLLEYLTTVYSVFETQVLFIYMYVPDEQDFVLKR